MQRVILRPSHRILIRHISRAPRSYTSASSPKPIPGPTKPYKHEKAPVPEQTWLTRKLKQSPTAMRVFLKISGALGYGSSRQVAARRALALYQQLCASREEEDRQFWAKECHLPPTFQSWFTVTNLHVWMLTTRLRALPAPYAQAHVQGLIDHFFLDVEDRIRQVLQPQSRSRSQPQARLATTAAPTSSSPSSTVPSPEKNTSSNVQADEPPKKRGAAPESLVKKQMKIFREQWAGLGLALDIALAHDSDAMVAAAMWRNLLGARGAQGLALALAPTSPVPEFRRAVNPGGTLANMNESALAREETRDDGSGVHDFGPEDRDAYVAFPETMLLLTAYLHGELTRLAAIPDEKIMGTGATLGRESVGVDELRFRKISSARAVIDNILEGP